MAEQDTSTAQATDQTETTGQASAEGEGTQGVKDGGNGADKPKPFTSEQEQYIGSWMGRIIKKQFDENVLPHLKTQNQASVPVKEQDEALKLFNEKVQEKLFSGDAVGAMDMVLNLKERAKENLTQTQNMNLMRGLTTYSDKPYYEDIQPEMQKLAKEKVSNGWPVQAALDASYSEAKAAHLEQRLTGGDREHSNLNLSASGRQAARTKATRLPPAFEKQCAKDIADGIYKNRDEWVKALAPKVKESLGL